MSEECKFTMEEQGPIGPPTNHHHPRQRQVVDQLSRLPWTYFSKYSATLPQKVYTVAAFSK